MMGRIVRWNKREGWVIGWTPYQHHHFGLMLFRDMRFKAGHAVRIENKYRRPKRPRKR